MFAAFLITFREVIEASLIVATILGILSRLGQSQSIKTVWVATLCATLVSILFLVGGSMMGVKVAELYEHQEALIEGILMIVSAIFITWAVFFLHNYFGRYKTKLLQKIKSTVDRQEQKALFILAFTAVFREGFEIVLFLSTVYFSSSPTSVLTGFAGGFVAALAVSFGLFTATLRLPIFYAFRATSMLLILFAGGLLAHGVAEFAEIGVLPDIGLITIPFIPQASTFAGSMTKAIFGLTQHMNYLQIGFYTLYVGFMTWWVFLRTKIISRT